MDEKIFKESIDRITEKVGEEQAAIIADDLGALKTAQNEALKKEQDYQKKIEELETTNKQLVASNAGLLRRIPVNEDNQLVPPSQTDNQPVQPPADPFDEFGRLKK